VKGRCSSLRPTAAETVLYAFCAKTNCADGANPENFGPLLADQAGNLSGTTVNGGGGLVCGGGGCGTVFKRAPDGTETVLHAFKGGSDAGSPKLGIIADPSGNLYGTTLEWLDGQFIQDGHGTVFKLRTEQVTSDFDGDGYSDILWQNTGGEVAIWKMNGTSVIGGGLGNRGPSWHAIATGHFYANGYSDILWQNTNGEIVIWEMNATSVIGGGLGNRWPSWHAIATGHFYANGHSDILWQNTNGKVVIWEMNGTNVVGGGSLGNPGPSGHVIGTGDYYGNGYSDIVFQNTSGEVCIWEMNWTTVIGGGSLGNPGPSWHPIGK